MKKLKIIAIISGALTLLQYAPLLFSWITRPSAPAVGIIGGADGPTQIVVSTVSATVTRAPLTALLWNALAFFFPACFLVSVAAMLVIAVRRRKGK
jgi:Na+-transporting methylmalonyl-CoA/oxaloacetate decarboxylase beta subunit